MSSSSQLMITGRARNPLLAISHSTMNSQTLRGRCTSKAPSTTHKRTAKAVEPVESIDFAPKNSTFLLQEMCSSSRISVCSTREVSVTSSLKPANAMEIVDPLFTASTAAQMQTITPEMIAAIERRHKLELKKVQSETVIANRGLSATAKGRVAAASALEKAQRKAERALAVAMNKPAF
eukprot:GILI01041368.1.p1 GENE.GILI01041368.1~~GILI01041368.1.p1  ORF type:complete len:179 (-),score=16.45 GILI01041368.1:76-612(-)